jgi:hypothetical protein
MPHDCFRAPFLSIIAPWGKVINNHCESTLVIFILSFTPKLATNITITPKVLRKLLGPTQSLGTYNPISHITIRVTRNTNNTKKRG